MKLGKPLIDAFNYFIQSDIFIMASIGFSFVPAIYRQNGLTISVPSKYYQELEEWVSDKNIEVKQNAIKKYIDKF